jgi:hypothetical protein
MSRAILSSLTAAWYGTVQQSTPKHKAKAARASQPADTSRPRPDHSRNDDASFCKGRPMTTGPGLAVGESKYYKCTC